jgi:DNA replicative helicase MCM subunit Mcm2 (Cdc46/Mcm family)
MSTYEKPRLIITPEELEIVIRLNHAANKYNIQDVLTGTESIMNAIAISPGGGHTTEFKDKEFFPPMFKS